MNGNESANFSCNTLRCFSGGPLMQRPLTPLVLCACVPVCVCACHPEVRGIDGVRQQAEKEKLRREIEAKHEDKQKAILMHMRAEQERLAQLQAETVRTPPSPSSIASAASVDAVVGVDPML